MNMNLRVIKGIDRNEGIHHTLNAVKRFFGCQEILLNTDLEIITGFSHYECTRIISSYAKFFNETSCCVVLRKCFGIKQPASNTPEKYEIGGILKQLGWTSTRRLYDENRPELGNLWIK